MATNGHSLDWAKLDAGSSGAASPMVNVESREELAKKAEEAMKIVQDRVEKGETSVVDGRALVPGEAEGKHSLEFIEVCLISPAALSFIIFAVSTHVNSASH